MAANSRFAVATHVMASLALKENEYVNSSYLASSVNTNPVVIRRLLGELQKAGLVETAAGKAGGARLARSASSIPLLDIYRAVGDETLFALNSNEPNRQCPVSCVMGEVLAPIFQSAARALGKELKRVRLADVVERLEKKGRRSK